MNTPVKSEDAAVTHVAAHDANYQCQVLTRRRIFYEWTNSHTALVT